MANNISSNPWILDTAGASLVWTGNVHIIEIEFQEYVADTDTCTLADAAGHVIWLGNGKSDLSTVRSGNIGFIHDGLAITQLTAGKVRIFHK